MTVLNDKNLEAAMATRPPRRATEEGIKGQIQSVRYFYDGTPRVPVVTRINGFKVVGDPAAASPENYGKNIGETCVFKNVFSQTWALEGYVLRNEIYAPVGGSLS